MNRLLVAFGTVLVAAGLLWPWLKRMHLFRLPGDIVIDRPGFKFFFPITTMLIGERGSIDHCVVSPAVEQSMLVGLGVGNTPYQASLNR